jgi:hypothetical protein
MLCLCKVLPKCKIMLVNKWCQILANEIQVGDLITLYHFLLGKQSVTHMKSSIFWAITACKKKGQSYPCNRPWRPIGLWDIEASTFFRQSAYRWWWGCQPYALVAFYHPGRFLVLISVRGWVDSTAIVQLEGLGQLKSPVTSSGIKRVTFWLLAHCLNQLCYRISPWRHVVC